MLSELVVANGKPTKEFFVQMLTRDIELKDAILDLLDNCLDGAQRLLSQTDTSNKYDGYFAKISFDHNHFTIEDNCGGIPYNDAINYAFRMGRPNNVRQETTGIPTIGVYGIGMKRAIFKMGREATVLSQTADHSFMVTIPKEWAESPDTWDFPVTEEQTRSTQTGTVIEIKSILPEIKNEFSVKNKLSFETSLIEAISTNFGNVMQKGFCIEVNGKNITGKTLKLLISPPHNSSKDSIKPYIFHGEIDSVIIDILIGFYAPIIDEETLENEISGHSLRSSDDAGITIVCNDRVVLYNNKDHLTGWGENGVPKYHTQFIGISGIAFFSCSDPSKLPMTTTKRGINLNSALYAQTRHYICEGLKMFTDYTNRWKGRIAEEREQSAATTAVKVSSLVTSVIDQSELAEKGIRLNRIPNSDNLLRFKPSLPQPKNEKTTRIISFSRPNDEIKELQEYLFDDNSSILRPKEVGIACFNQMLKISRKAKQ